MVHQAVSQIQLRLQDTIFLTVSVVTSAVDGIFTGLSINANVEGAICQDKISKLAVAKTKVVLPAQVRSAFSTTLMLKDLLPKSWYPARYWQAFLFQ